MNVKIKGSIGDIVNMRGFYLEEVDTETVIGFICQDCGEFFTLDNEHSNILCHCHICGEQWFDEEDMLERRERIAYFEEYGYPEPVKEGEFNF